MNNGVISIDDLELKIEKDAVLSIEDLIFILLFKEKGLSKRDISKSLEKVSFIDINKTLIAMENKGFIVNRLYSQVGEFYLTVAGAFEAEYRLNTNVYYDLFYYLSRFGYEGHNISAFLRNRFYQFYLAGKWDGNNLNEQYLEWCESNDLNPKGPEGRKLTMDKKW